MHCFQWLMYTTHEWHCCSLNLPPLRLSYCIPRAGSRFVPSQWETPLQSNSVSHWLGANIESALYPYGPRGLWSVTAQVALFHGSPRSFIDNPYALDTISIMFTKYCRKTGFTCTCYRQSLKSFLYLDDYSTGSFYDVIASDIYMQWYCCES